jgi:hypothetical protein
MDVLFIAGGDDREPSSTCGEHRGRDAEGLVDRGGG